MQCYSGGWHVSAEQMYNSSHVVAIDLLIEKCDWRHKVNGLLVWGCAPVGSSILHSSSDSIRKEKAKPKPKPKVKPNRWARARH